MPCEPLFDRLWFSFHLKYFKTYHQEHMFNLCTVILWCAIVKPYCDTQSLRTLYREWSNYKCTYFDDFVWKLIMIKLNSHPIISKLWENYLVITRKESHIITRKKSHNMDFAFSPTHIIYPWTYSDFRIQQLNFVF